MIARFVLGVLATLSTAVSGFTAVSGSTTADGSATQPATAGPGATTPTVTGPAVASGPRVAPGVQAGPARLDLLGQTSEVEAGQSWQIHLAVRAPSPTTDRLRLAVYDRLTTRTGFDETLAGRSLGSSVWRSAADPLPTLPGDTGGGVTLGVPVDSDLPGVAERESGIYPVQVQLLDADYNQLRTLTTYLVFVAGSPAQTGFPKLDVSLSLPIHARPVLPAAAPPASDATAAAIADWAGRLAPATVDALAAEVAALQRHRTVPVSLQVTPQTADMLQASAASSGAGGSGAAGSGGAAATGGGSAGTGSGRSASAGSGSASAGPREVPGQSVLARAVLRDIGQLVAGEDELLPGTYVDTSLRALAAANLSSEITEQLSAGAASLGADIHRLPETTTWVVDGPLDLAAAQELQAHGATRVILPAADLQALPQSGLQFTVAVPAELSAGRTHLSVDAADTELGQHFVNSGDQILVANQLLAELAMIQLETPSRVRGVAIMPPPGWHPSPAFLDTLLTGLTSNPLIQPVTADQLFSDVPVGTNSRSKVVRGLAGRQAPAPLPGAATVVRARAVANGYSAVLPKATAASSELDRRILIAESSDLSSSQRAQVLGSVVAAAAPLQQAISLPAGTSITLTARKGNLPLTILDHPGLPVRIELRLSSDKLTFEPFAPAGGGGCSRPSESSESCELTLSSPVTTVKVPVEARTSGVFTLNIAVVSPDGSLLFASNRDTVRSTAVSGVGVILIVLAALGLGYWWLRNIRHGRRARQLIDVGGPPDQEESKLSDGQTDRRRPGSASADGRVELNDLDQFADFFASPPPVYPRPSSPPGPSEAGARPAHGLARPGAPPVSPSGGPSGRRK